MILFYSLIGICLGSFFNVIVSRSDWYKGRSRCDLCGGVLRWYEIIPFVSFLIQRGRCRRCNGKIDISHVAAEAFGLLGGIVLAFMDFDFVLLITVLVLLFNGIMDFKTRYVSTLVTYSGAACLLFIKLYSFDDRSLMLNSIITLGVTAIALVILYFLLGCKLGAGDFDIIFLLILALGHFDAFYCIIYSSIMGVVYALVRGLKRKDPFPFVPFFYMGFLVTILII